MSSGGCFNYILPLNTNLTCCICRAPFFDPVTAKSCSHTFCRECIHQALQHSELCPVDRSPLSPDVLFPADPIIRSLVDELLVECENRPLGCMQTIQRQLHDTHLRDSCQYTEVPCDRPECKELLMRKDQPNHESNCPHRIVTCEGCQASIKFKDIETHIPQCPATTSSCPSCSLEMPRTELDTHISTCPEFVISCAHSGSGCPWTGPRYSLDNHLPSCPYEAIKGFFAINNTRLSDLSTENALLRQKVELLETQTRGMKRDLHAIASALGPWYRPDGVYVPVTQQATVESTSEGQPTLPSTFVDPRRSPNFPANNGGGLGTIPPIVDSIAAFFPLQEREQYNVSSSSLDPGPRHHNHSASTSEVSRPTQSSVAPINLSSTIEGAFEGLRESVVTIASSVDSLARRNDIALTNETLRLNEELMSLRANIHGLRMQVHTIMMDRNAQVTGRSNDFAPAVNDPWQPPITRVHFPPPMGHSSITKL